MKKRILNQIFSKELPNWFKFLNLSILLPILLWPLVFYMTIFFFDNPKNLGLTYLLFFVVNAYPLYFIIIAYFNSLLFQKYKLVGSLLPSTILLTLIFCVIYVVFLMSNNISQKIKKSNERTKQGYIGALDDFKIINDNVYRYDTLIVGADAETFKIVSWDWQCDKNYYYRFGKKIPYIDRETFEDLGYYYGKDKYHVYYAHKILKGADPKTFVQIEFTDDGKDSNNCYRLGKKVDCEVLKTEY